MLHGDLCILYFGPGERQFLIALDKSTGKTVWKTEQPALVERPRSDGFRGREQGGMIGSFSTPILIDTGDRQELVMSYPQLLCGYDPVSGKELWRADGLNELIYASPIAGEGVVVGMGGFLGTTIAVASGAQGNVTEDNLLWTSVRTKNRLGSGVTHQGHIYILNSDGIAECLDLKTGREVWQERLPKKGPKGDSWSSMVLAGNHLYVLNQSADTVVLKASPKFEVVSVNPLDDTLTNASLAVSKGDLFIRTHAHLWCISAAELQAEASDGTNATRSRIVQSN
jgi:outer membrane protein assembly factor BamB